MATNDLGTAELGLLGMDRGEPTAADIQRGIDRTMAETVRDRPYAPKFVEANVRVAGAPTVVTRGWVEPKPYSPPPGQAAIEQLANHFLPSARVERLRAMWATLRPDEQAELLAANPGFRKVVEG